MSNARHKNEFSWVGSQSHYVDEIDVCQIQNVTVGRFGGNSTAGQYKNEDACLVWTNEKEDWEFVVLLDAHQSAESAELVVSEVNSLKGAIQNNLTLPIKQAFEQTAETLLTTFDSPHFKEACQKIQGGNSGFMRGPEREVSLVVIHRGLSSLSVPSGTESVE